MSKIYLQCKCRQACCFLAGLIPFSAGIHIGFHPFFMGVQLAYYLFFHGYQTSEICHKYLSLVFQLNKAQFTKSNNSVKSINQSNPIPLLTPVVTSRVVTLDWFWITGFINRVWIVTTNNYNSFTELHIPNITVTTAHINSSEYSLVMSWLHILILSTYILTIWHISLNSTIALSQSQSQSNVMTNGQSVLE
jgi:hypothetical protein